MTIEEAQQNLVEQFDGLDDWMDRYAVIIDMGNTHSPIDEKLKTPDRLIEGCQSRVWITADTDEEGRAGFRADSDALIVKGIVALLLRVLSGHKPEEIIGADLYFIDRIGLKDHLSPTRSNGLVAMVKQMRNYAVAFKALENN